MDLAYNRAYACACRAADERAFEAATEEGAKHGSSACTDERAFSWPDAALMLLLISVVVALVIVVILTTASAVANSVVKLAIVVVIAVATTISGLSVHRKNRGK